MNELRLIPADRTSSFFPALDALMNRAFPENERVPMEHLLRHDDGHEMLAIMQGDAFAGFISLLTHGDICHILFFATEEHLRGQGVGARALSLLREMKPGLRIIADLEACVDSAPDLSMRQRRIAFYHRCGFEDTPVGYRWRGEDYVILSNGGNVTDEEFWNFWKAYDRPRPAGT